MWLQHLRHLTLTNQQRHSIATHAKRHMGLAHTRLSSVRQPVVHQAVRRDVGVGMGQVTQTTHHIGLGNPMWGREGDPGPREFSRGSDPGWKVWPGGRAFLVSAPTPVVTGVGVGPKGQCVCHFSVF